MGVQEVIDGYNYLNNLIKLGPGDWVGQLLKMNKDVYERNRHQKATWRRFLLHFFQTTSSGNVLGAFNWQLSMVRKDTGFGTVLPEEALEIRQV